MSRPAPKIPNYFNGWGLGISTIQSSSSDFILFYFKAYFFREREWGRDRQRGREGESPGSSALTALTLHGAPTLELWDHTLSHNQESDTEWTESPRCSTWSDFNKEPVLRTTIIRPSRKHCQNLKNGNIKCWWEHRNWILSHIAIESLIHCELSGRSFDNKFQIF